MGAGIFLVAVGAILTFAVEVDESNGFDLNALGVILMIIGAVGILLSMVYWGSWGGAGWGRRDTVVYRRAPRRQAVVYESTPPADAAVEAPVVQAPVVQAPVAQPGADVVYQQRPRRRRTVIEE